jgi:hypothetical protein
MNRLVQPLRQLNRIGALRLTSLCGPLASSGHVMFNSISIFNRKKKKTIEEIEAYDIDRLDQIIPISVALSEITIKHSHLLHEVSQSIKDELASDGNYSDASVSGSKTKYVHRLAMAVAQELEQFNDLHLYRENCILDNLEAPPKVSSEESAVVEGTVAEDAEAVEPAVPLTDGEHFVQHKEEFETMIRLRLLHNYLRRIQRAVQDGEVDIALLDNQTKCLSLVDAFLRGTPAERIAQHIELYGPTLTPWLTQSCFYAICDPEVETLSDFWLSEMERVAVLPTRKRRFLPFLTTSVKPAVKHSELQLENLRLFKEHKKELVPFTKTYLLDTLELNVKARCCFAWTGKFVCFIVLVLPLAL